MDPRYIPRVIYAGVDEAGYGPLLGPLCVGLSAFRLADAEADSIGGGAPDLWKMLSRGVCRKPKDARRRVAVADSKKLKSGGKQPLVHLERGVLAFLGGETPKDDGDYLVRLGMSPRATRATPWHAHRLPVPVALTEGEVAIARNLVRGAMDDSGCAIEALGVSALDAPAFNALYGELRNKASVNMSLVFDAVRRVDLLRGDAPAFVAVDRQGGRADYTGELEAHVARGAAITTLVADDERSVYRIDADGTAPLLVSFEVGAEERHLPVALASMAAKYTREVSMRRLNAYFSERVPGLEPTAGYVEDGRRYLAEVKPVLAREAISERDFVRVV
jgi:ribonuclease HII